MGTGITTHLKDVYVKRGDDIVLYCEANHYCRAHWWMKNNENLHNSDRIIITQQGRRFTMIIRDAREEDSGEYSITLHLDLERRDRRATPGHPREDILILRSSATVKLLDFNKDWRKTETDKNEEMKRNLEAFIPSNPEVKQLRFLLHGPVGAGKSSLINSINSTFQGRLTVSAQAAEGVDTSFTKKYKTYHIRNQQRQILPFVFNDMMGLEHTEKGGVLTTDIISALKGHINEGYKFHENSPLSEGDHGYVKHPRLSDKVHCLVSVIPTDRLSIYDSGDLRIKKMQDVREAASDLDIPQVVFMTHVDKVCPIVAEDLKHMYSNKKIKEKMQLCSNMLRVPMNCIFPVKNYHEETDMNDQVDFFILSALKNIVNFADDYVNSQEVP